MLIDNVTLQRLINAVQELSDTESSDGCDGGLTVIDQKCLSVVEGLVEGFKEDLQILDYVENDGVTCPVCDSKNIEGNSSFDPNVNFVIQSVRCNECGKEWTDEYKLVNAFFDDKE